MAGVLPHNLADCRNPNLVALERVVALVKATAKKARDDNWNREAVVVLDQLAVEVNSIVENRKG
jgi:hypothetical protein